MRAPRDAEVLGQRADQLGDQLLAQPGHQPREVVGLDPVEGGDGHVDGEPVVGGAGLEVVADREGQPGLVAVVPLRREVVVAHLAGRVVGEHLGVEGEQVGLLLPRALPPLVEVLPADDVGADAGVVEVEEGLLVDDDVAAAGPVLELLGLLEEAGVLGEEPVPGVPLPLDEGVPDEELAGQRRVDPAVLHEPVGDQRDAVQRDPLVGHHRRALARPVRLGVGPLDQVGAEALGPLGLDGGVLPGPQARGLDQLGAHQEVGLRPFSTLPGKTAKRALRAPRYSRIGRRSPGLPFSRSSSAPMWLSRPDSSAWWMPSSSAGSSGGWPDVELHLLLPPGAAGTRSPATRGSACS